MIDVIATGNIPLTSYQITVEGGGSKVMKLTCASCSAELGFDDPITDGYILHKWAVQVRKDNEPAQIYPLQKWVSALLLSQVSSTVDRKLIVESETPEGDDQEPLLVRGPPPTQRPSLPAHRVSRCGSSPATSASPARSGGPHGATPRAP